MKPDLTHVGVRNPRGLFTLRESRRGNHELCEHGSDRCETSAKRVSEDSQLSIFSRRNFFFENFSDLFLFSHNFRQILEDLGFFGRQNRVPGGILLRMGGFSGPYEAWSDPQRRGSGKSRKFLGGARAPHLSENAFEPV